MAKRILVIGGVAAGPSAAAKARRMDEEAEIILFEQGEYISYSGCGLPYYVGGVVQDRNDLIVMTPASFKARHNVEVLTRNRVTKIDPVGKKITVENTETQTFQEYFFDALIIATGATPVVPPIPGIQLPGIFKLHTVPDADSILAAANQRKGGNAVIVGAGLIGLEMAESLTTNGLSVTIVEKAPQVLPSYDFEMAFLIEEHLREKGVKVIKEDEVSSFEGDQKGVQWAVLERGKRIPADLVLLSMGVRPQVSLAAEAGIHLGPTGAIKVDSFMQTNIPAIYAAGDCAESYNLLTRMPVWGPSGSVANRQGRTAGENAAGGERHFPGVLGGSVAKIFELTAARTGLNEKEAQKYGYDFLAVHLHPLNRAHICPSAKEMSMKLIVDAKTEKLLGAQIIGVDGADKRIDVFSTAIHSGMKCSDLFDIDFAYSPPYAPAKDPAGIGGLVAENALHSGVTFVSPLWLKEHFYEKGDKMLLVDVREPHEITQDGGLKDAVNIPLNQLRARISEIDRDLEVVLYCRQGLRVTLQGRFW